MAEDTFRHILIGFILFSLFGFLILSAVNSTGTTYGKDMTLLNGVGNLSAFNSSLSDVESTAKSMQNRFETQNVWSALVGVVVDGIFKLSVDMVKMIWAPFDLVRDIMLDNLHVPAIVSSIILAILIFTIMFSIWSLLKIGN